MVAFTLTDIQRALRLPAALIEMGEIWSLDEATMACIFTLHDDLWHNTIDQVLPFCKRFALHPSSSASNVLPRDDLPSIIFFSANGKIDDDDEGLE